MKHKSLNGIEIKNADTGEVEAIFSTLNVVDSDGDVTLPGAFTDGQPVRISAYGHQSWQGALPVGKGTIHEDGDVAIFKGTFFLDTTPGRDTFNTVKNLGELGEWSYSLHDVKSHAGELDGKSVNFLEKINVHEVSPVLKGAGIGTRTLAVKSDLKFSEHITAVVADVDELIKRASEVMALRAQKGKTLGGESADLLTALTADIDRLRAVLEPGDIPPTELAADDDEGWSDALDLLAAAATFQGAVEL